MYIKSTFLCSFHFRKSSIYLVILKYFYYWLTRWRSGCLCDCCAWGLEIDSLVGPIVCIISQYCFKFWVSFLRNRIQTSIRIFWWQAISAAHGLWGMWREIEKGLRYGPPASSLIQWNNSANAVSHQFSVSLWYHPIRAGSFMPKRCSHTIEVWYFLCILSMYLIFVFTKSTEVFYPLI